MRAISARHTAGDLAEEGAAVVIADILDGEAVANEIRAKGGKAMALKIDVSKEDDTSRMAAKR